MDMFVRRMTGGREIATGDAVWDLWVLGNEWVAKRLIKRAETGSLNASAVVP